MQELAADVEGQLGQLQRELTEIELLLQQARIEAERHEGRRKQAAERLPALEADRQVSPDALTEARAQLITLTRRAATMEAQIQVLEGKEKNLRRFLDYLRDLAPRLADLDGSTDGAPAGPASARDSRAVLAAQEEMRREIARQMHDGPAQSIANIALQAQVVQQLMRRDPQQAEAALDELGQMVQHTLDATKSFIFDVRPMVLDDLGLVATLRRSGLERARRAGIPVRFESVGPDRRLDPEIESTLFRIVEDAVGGFASGSPAEVLVRLDWLDDSLRAQVRSRYRENAVAPEQHNPRAPDGDVPPALAAMIDEQRAWQAASDAARQRARGLSDEVWHEISSRAGAVGIAAELSQDRLELSASVALPR